MGQNPGSINEGCRSLDIQEIEREGVQEESAKLYRQATADAAFIRNLSMKQESADRVYPFSSATNPICSLSVGHQDYAFYRQKYLVMYNPFITLDKKEDKKSVKEKINKWFTMNLKKQNKPKAKTPEPNHNSPPESKDKDKSLSLSFLDSVLRFLRCSGAHGYVHQVRKSSAVSPVS